MKFLLGALIALFLSMSSASAEDFLVGMASDLTPGFRCEVNQMPASDYVPMMRVTLNCTREISDAKARELVAATFRGRQVIIFDRRTFDVWNEIRPQDQNFCMPSIEWKLDIVPPGSYMVF